MNLTVDGRERYLVRLPSGIVCPCGSPLAYLEKGREYEADVPCHIWYWECAFCHRLISAAPVTDKVAEEDLPKIIGRR